MKFLRIVIPVVILLGVAFWLVTGPFWTRLNPAGEQRYRVDDQTYGVMMIGGNESQLEVGLIRSLPPGAVDQTDVDRISSVEGIALVDSACERLPVQDVVIQPDAGDGGLVSLVFDVGGHPEPWTLEWPGHDPYPINM